MISRWWRASSTAAMGGLLPAPATPLLILTVGVTDNNTPTFALDGNLAVGDVVRFQYSTSVVFSGASEIVNTIDVGQDASDELTFSTGALGDGTWYFRARIERSGHIASNWSNTLAQSFHLGLSALLINATGLVGQTDVGGNPVYTTAIAYNGQGGPTAKGFAFTHATALDRVNHRLFVTDSDNSRILIFPLDSTNHISSTTAVNVLGQPDFTSTGAHLTQNGFNTFFSSLVHDPVNNRLFVNDLFNNRVMVFELNSLSDNMNASYVIGQADFTSGGSGLARNRFNENDGIAYDPINSRLFVDDWLNHRIMVFSVPVGSNLTGIDADYVIGQTDFTTSTPGTARNKTGEVSGVIYDPINSRIFVNDGVTNNRVMIFSVPVGANLTGIDADYVIGQTNFTTSTPGLTRSKLDGPDDMLGYDPATSRLFVSDWNNSRVMIFSVPVGANLTGINAQNVLGQSDYVSAITGDTQSRFVHPNGTDSFDPINNRLFVKDKSNYRVLEFTF